MVAPGTELEFVPANPLLHFLADPPLAIGDRSMKLGWAVPELLGAAGCDKTHEDYKHASPSNIMVQAVLEEMGIARMQDRLQFRRFFVSPEEVCCLFVCLTAACPLYAA